MRSTTRLLVIAGIFLAAALPRPAWADITHIQDGRMCPSGKGCEGKGPIPIRQGETRTLNVKGQNVNFCSSATGDNTVTVTILGTKPVADGFAVGTGQIDLRVAVANNATPGNHTITLGNCLGGTFTFRIAALRNGNVTGINAVPRQNAYFTQVDLTLTGTNIAGAGAKLLSTSLSSGGNVNASVVASNATSATVRLTFTAPQSKATGQIRLFDASHIASCLPTHTFGCYGQAIAYTILGPNAIESISLPTGTTIRPGSVMTVRIRVTQPAPTGSFNPQTGGSLGGELVKWQVHPTNVFAAEPGTTFDPARALNDIRISAGAQQADVVLRLLQLPPGCINTCTGTVEARVYDFRDAAPYKRTMTFTISR